jgi:Fe2+ or Zn2+ uptake regulation protein
MTTPTCPKCENTRFAAEVIEPDGSRFKMIAVCCTSCGAVVGVEPYCNTEHLLRQIADHFGFKLE